VATSRRGTTALTAACYAAMTFLGVGFAIVGAAAKDVGVSAARVGALVACQQLGFAAGVLFAGLARDGQARARRLAIGCFVLATALLCSFRSGAFLFDAVALAGVGAGMGTFEGSTDALLIALHRTGASRQINLSHFFVTVGAAGITVALMLWPVGWRTSVDAVAIGALAVGLLFAQVRVPAADPQPATAARAGIGMDGRRFAALFAYGVLVVGAELGAMAFIASYGVDVLGLSQATSKATLLAFLVGVASGRALVGALMADRYLPTALACAAAAASFTFIALFGVTAVPPAVWIGAAALAGAGVSATLPLMLASGAREAGAAAPRAIALLKLCIPAGGVATPALVSRATAALGLEQAVAVIPACAVLAFGIAAALALGSNHRKARG
jgi:predicted MFS family arabinose efflux permease